jgi:hypothetical protein|tara:strand:+ start:49 stop:438 length:390 start_codon:yes stop_codon:yes gene_type:complete
LNKGDTVTIKVENVMWPYKDRYMPGVIRDEFNYYTGTVVYEKWYKPNQVGLTTGQDWFPVRVVERHRIVEVNELPVDYTEPASDRIEKKVQGSKGNEYTVVKEYGKSTCTCPGFTFRGQCKHLLELVNG